MKSLAYNFRRTADDLRLRTFPLVPVHEFYIQFVCVFESKVNIWRSKHHIQHISVALGLFSVLFSPTDQKQKPSRAG